VVDDVYVCAESEAFQTSDDTKRLGVKSVGATDGFLEYARENDFGICGTDGSVSYSRSFADCFIYIPANFEGGRSHWRELGNDLEDAVELALG
jgi:hypothetical protein